MHDDTARTARLKSVDVSSINDIYVLKIQKYPVFSRRDTIVITIFAGRGYMKKVLSVILCAAMLFAFGGCNFGKGSKGSHKDRNYVDHVKPGAGRNGGGGSGLISGGVKIGISMPTKDLLRWNSDGDQMKYELEAAGFYVDLQYANNDVNTQISQLENMINAGCLILIIAPIESSALFDVLEMAEAKNVTVISYDRLIMDSPYVDYYVTFDDYMAGAMQGEYIVNSLNLDNYPGPFNLEISAGDPADNKAFFYYSGAMDVLRPYIDSGKLVVVSGQWDFDSVSTQMWSTEQAQSRAENILAAFYSDGTQVDAWLCSNDSTALGVINAIDSFYSSSLYYPVITGQDCNYANVKLMLEGKQAMSVFKDTRTLASQTVRMAVQIANGEVVDVNDDVTYNNGKIVVPSYLCAPVFADSYNYEEILIDSGYYTYDQLH